MPYTRVRIHEEAMAALTSIFTIVDSPPLTSQEEVRALGLEYVRRGTLPPSSFEDIFGEKVPPEVEAAWPETRKFLLRDTAIYMARKGNSPDLFRRVFGEEPPAGVFDAATGR